MSIRHAVAAGIAAAALAGCVTVPTGPEIAVMPGSRKSFDEFRSDDLACRDYAQSFVGGPAAAQGANDAAVTNAVVGTAIGAAAGAVLGSASGNSGPGAAIGAGAGLLVGSAAGSNAAGYSSYSLQRRYDTAYAQCMYARGNQVPARVAYRAPYPYYYRAAPYPVRPAPVYPVQPPEYYPPPPAAGAGSYPPPNYPPPNYPPPVAPDTSR